MKYNLFILGTIILFICSPVTSVIGDTRVIHDKENVVASRLSGTWILEKQLTRRLTGEEVEEIEIEFINDEPILAVIPFPDLVRDTEIYLAGVMNMGGMSYPFVLITHHGNPHVVFFRDNEEGPMGDVESFTVMMAIAEDERNDLLFIGGDFNNQPFSAFFRAKDDYER
jgi:hypothetical protein